MIKLEQIRGMEKGKIMMVVGGGATIRSHQMPLQALIKDKWVVSIGINKLLPYIVPDYHLWTNTQRYRDMGDCLHPLSIMMFGSGLSRQIIRKHYKKDDYIIVDYTSDLKRSLKEPVGYKNGKISGHFRTAGCLAVMICHLMEAGKIYICGMDGYTLYSKEALDSKEQNHHCYGKGYTDTADWATCKQKDETVYNTLRELRDYGIQFKIITPTVFEEFYDPTVLGEYDG